MKKFLAILLAMMLVMVSVAALAEDENVPPYMNGQTAPASSQDQYATIINGATGKIGITKNYDIVGATNHPADELQFAVAWNGAEDTGVDFDANDWNKAPNLPTIAPVPVSEDKDAYKFMIVLPTYSTYGVFKYKITEVDTKVAGMTYNYTGETNKKTLYLRVGVVKKENATATDPVEIQYVAIREADGKETTQKTDSITNKYEAGDLTISKTVTGNLGDKSKVFKFTVTFKTTGGEKVKSTIGYEGTDGGVADTDEITINENTPTGKVNGSIGYTETVTGEDGKTTTNVGWEEKTVYVALADGQTMKFTNIPEGVQYTVHEDDYTGEGYIAVTDVTDEMVPDGHKTAAFTNTKNSIPDMGITLETLPYVLMMALAMMGFVALKLRKREEY